MHLFVLAKGIYIIYSVAAEVQTVVSQNYCGKRKVRRWGGSSMIQVVFAFSVFVSSIGIIDAYNRQDPEPQHVMLDVEGEGLSSGLGTVRGEEIYVGLVGTAQSAGGNTNTQDGTKETEVGRFAVNVNRYRVVPGQVF